MMLFHYLSSLLLSAHLSSQFAVESSKDAGVELENIKPSLKISDTSLSSLRQVSWQKTLCVYGLTFFCTASSKPSLGGLVCKNATVGAVNLNNKARGAQKVNGSAIQLLLCNSPGINLGVQVVVTGSNNGGSGGNQGGGGGGGFEVSGGGGGGGTGPVEAEVPADKESSSDANKDVELIGATPVIVQQPEGNSSPSEPKPQEVGTINSDNEEQEKPSTEEPLKTRYAINMDKTGNYVVTRLN